MEITEIHRRILLAVARRAIRRALDVPPSVEAAAIAPEPGDPVLAQPAGCFVTLHHRQTRRLRGCIGRLEARDPLLKAVEETAVGVLDDPRFVHQRVTGRELPELELEITILSPLKPVVDPLDFDLLNDGLYLVFGNRAGCFLPQVARETGWTKQQLLDRLCTEKLGLSSHVWRNPHARLHTFSAIIIGPEPFDESSSSRSDGSAAP